ncbi:MAG: hypothetical protein ACLPVY_08415 [Acidimicrobiia bacterium]
MISRDRGTRDAGRSLLFVLGGIWQGLGFAQFLVFHPFWRDGASALDHVLTFGWMIALGIGTVACFRCARHDWRPVHEGDHATR